MDAVASRHVLCLQSSFSKGRQLSRKGAHAQRFDGELPELPCRRYQTYTICMVLQQKVFTAGSTSSMDMGSKPEASSRQSRSTAGGLSLKCCSYALYASCKDVKAQTTGCLHSGLSTRVS